MNKDDDDDDDDDNDDDDDDSDDDDDDDSEHPHQKFQGLPLPRWVVTYPIGKKSASTRAKPRFF